nr:acylphosphatase [Halomonas sp. G15]
MRNWVAQLPDGNHVQQAWHTITEAAHRLFCDKAKVEPWKFNLPKGLPPQLKNDDILTLRLHIQGKVQDVGYRRWFATQLEDRAIPGWVRNLPDGSVEAVIHGRLADLQPLCDEVPKGPEAANVTGLNVTQWDGEIPEDVQVMEAVN